MEDILQNIGPRFHLSAGRLSTSIGCAGWPTHPALFPGGVWGGFALVLPVPGSVVNLTGIEYEFMLSVEANGNDNCPLAPLQDRTTNAERLIDHWYCV